MQAFMTIVETSVKSEISGFTASSDVVKDNEAGTFITPEMDTIEDALDEACIASLRDHGINQEGVVGDAPDVRTFYQRRSAQQLSNAVFTLPSGTSFKLPNLNIDFEKTSEQD
jgi:hypothetical protein